MINWDSHIDNDSYSEFLRSAEWQAKRDEIIKRDGGRCQMCKSESNLRVHHKSYDDLLDDDNLITLCNKCHEHVHAYTKAFNKALTDENSELRKSIDMYNKAVTKLIDAFIYARCAELNEDADVHFFTGPRDSKVNINDYIESLISLDPYHRPIQVGEADSWISARGRATWTRYEEIRLGRRKWSEFESKGILGRGKDD